MIFIFLLIWSLASSLNDSETKLQRFELKGDAKCNDGQSYLLALLNNLCLSWGLLFFDSDPNHSELTLRQIFSTRKFKTWKVFL